MEHPKGLKNTERRCKDQISYKCLAVSDIRSLKPAGSEDSTEHCKPCFLQQAWPA